MSHEQGQGVEPHGCRRPFAGPSGAPSSNTADRNVRDVKLDPVRLALNRKIANRMPRKPLPSERAAIIEESLKCLTGETPAPSLLVIDPGYRLIPQNDTRFGNWGPHVSPLACLNRSLFEFREQELTPDEQLLATPREIRTALQCNKLPEMRVLWKNKLNNMKAEAARQQQQQSEPSTVAYSFDAPAPTQSVFEEDTEDEDEEDEEPQQIQVINHFERFPPGPKWVAKTPSYLDKSVMQGAVCHADDSDGFDNTQSMADGMLARIALNETEPDSGSETIRPPYPPSRKVLKKRLPLPLLEYDNWQQRLANTLNTLREIANQAPVHTPDDDYFLHPLTFTQPRTPPPCPVPAESPARTSEDRVQDTFQIFQGDRVPTPLQPGCPRYTSLVPVDTTLYDISETF